MLKISLDNNDENKVLLEFVMLKLEKVWGGH